MSFPFSRTSSAVCSPRKCLTTLTPVPASVVVTVTVEIFLSTSKLVDALTLGAISSTNVALTSKLDVTFANSLSHPLNEYPFLVGLVGATAASPSTTY